jgi:hypothetical protein
MCAPFTRSQIGKRVKVVFFFLMMRGGDEIWQVGQYAATQCVPILFYLVCSEKNPLEFCKETIFLIPIEILIDNFYIVQTRGVDVCYVFHQLLF